MDADHAGRGGSLGAEGLVAIAETARAALGVRGHLAERSETVPLLAARADEIAETLTIVADRLERTLELDPPGVKDSASPKLKSLRSELATARRRASDRLRSLASDPDLQPHLQEDFVTERGGRPAGAGARADVGVRNRPRNRPRHQQLGADAVRGCLADIVNFLSLAEAAHPSDFDVDDAASVRFRSPRRHRERADRFVQADRGLKLFLQAAHDSRCRRSTAAARSSAG